MYETYKREHIGVLLLMELARTRILDCISHYVHDLPMPVIWSHAANYPPANHHHVQSYSISHQQAYSPYILNHMPLSPPLTRENDQQRMLREMNRMMEQQLMEIRFGHDEIFVKDEDISLMMPLTDATH